MGEEERPGVHDADLVSGGKPPPVRSPGGAAALEDRRSNIFFSAIQTTRMPMIVTDPRKKDNPIIFANRAFLKMTGYELSEIEGENCRLLQGPETNPDTISAVSHAVRSRREIATEILNYRKDGTTFWNALFVSPVYNEQGELVYFFGSQLDITRRRDAEEALRQSQKMEAIGQLTGGIAHDFNNLLQVIVGYVDSLRLHIGHTENPKVERGLDNIASAAQRAAVLTQQLLAFARKQHLDGRAVNLNALIEGMAEMASRTMGAQIRISTHPDPALWNARIDTVQMETALLNVLINARDAMPKGGEVRLTTRNVVIEPSEDLALGGMSPGRYVSISIADTGAGMPPEILARAAEPFFTTKETGKGTGLGLAMVYGFVKQSGGSVRISSEEGKGTRITLYFPVVDQVDRVKRSEGQRASDRQGHETILIVEDREDVAELAQAILEEFGYRVIRGKDPKSALEILEDGEDVHLLFTDMIMPGGMNGVVLAREALKRRPKLKILLTTGYAEASIERTDAGGSEFEVLNKPYRRHELARRVRSILDGPTGTG
ncbi:MULTISPECIES: histidine kinase famiy protein [Bradyrhizobium]